ncbi:class I SAM-dependent methyltransferase [Scatolibacter rhodanostii]|uniref:class I SAM-dependent methyltransferase n=1 Tax=Scatolibacter rhodanostii TaxID=2014781 RepID=UPI000C085B7F|nr:class I SAM-dependent methyltransferase [Scatolibacter rhodanostii]
MSDDLITYWKREEQAAFAGWDFSHLEGRYAEGKPPWDYREKVKAFLKPQTRLLDMDTGAGEFLLSLRHPYALTSVTESYPPNVELCQKRLTPLGITVAAVEGTAKLPFEESSFDVVINRHGSYDIKELKRILKPNGFFITQQVGSSNNRELSSYLCPDFMPTSFTHNLENESKRFADAGFRLMYQNQSYQKTVFTEVGALCYYAKQIPWEFPEFSVNAAQEKLLKLHELCEQEGKIESTAHRFMIVAKNHK